MKKILLLLPFYFGFQIAAQTTVLQENFTNYLGTAGTVPAGWNFSYNGNYTTAASSGTSGPNSYKFGANNATITTPPFANADTVHFWIKGQGVDTVSKLTVLESSDSVTWTTLAAIDHLPGTGTKYGFLLNSTTNHLRFTFTKSVGNLAFDDFLVLKNSVISSPGTIKIYFNHPVNNSLSTGQNAIYLNQCVDDTLIAYINRSKYSLDIAVYDYIQTAAISNIATAVNNAYLRGVKVRWIYDGTASNSGISLLNAGIPTVASPTTSVYGIMHNKFMIADANSPNAADALVWTGSCNWDDQQMNSDFNNIIIIQSQPFAQNYTTEFNEMWGDTGLVPNATNSKFGPFKTDNTFHQFNIGGKRIDCFFSPSDGSNSHLSNAISSANSQLFFGVFSFTVQSLADSIKSKMQTQGVYTAGIMDQSSLAFAAYASLNPAMGVMLQVYNQNNSVYHNKILIVDPCNTSSDPLVSTGSHNWTASADTKNDENILFIHDAAITNVYYQSFEQNFSDVGGLLATCSVGMDEEIYASEKINVYPNPATGFISVENESSKINSLTVYDLTGKKIIRTGVISNQKTKIDVSALNNGIYLLEINSENGTAKKRIIVQH